MSAFKTLNFLSVAHVGLQGNSENSEDTAAQFDLIKHSMQFQKTEVQARCLPGQEQQWSLFINN